MDPYHSPTGTCYFNDLLKCIFNPQIKVLVLMLSFMDLYRMPKISSFSCLTSSLLAVVEEVDVLILSCILLYSKHLFSAICFVVLCFLIFFCNSLFTVAHEHDTETFTKT